MAIGWAKRRMILTEGKIPLCFSLMHISLCTQNCSIYWYWGEGRFSYFDNEYKGFRLDFWLLDMTIITIVKGIFGLMNGGLYDQREFKKVIC